MNLPECPQCNKSDMVIIGGLSYQCRRCNTSFIPPYCKCKGKESTVTNKEWNDAIKSGPVTLAKLCGLKVKDN